MVLINLACTAYIIKKYHAYNCLKNFVTTCILLTAMILHRAKQNNHKFTIQNELQQAVKPLRFPLSNQPILLKPLMAQV